MTAYVETYPGRKTGERFQRVVGDERMLGVIRDLHRVNYEASDSRRM